jgi:hypothetical protein
LTPEKLATPLELVVANCPSKSTVAPLTRPEASFTVIEIEPVLPASAEGEGEGETPALGDALGVAAGVGVAAIFDADVLTAGAGVGVAGAGPFSVYVTPGSTPFQTLDPEVLSMSDPEAIDTWALPPANTVKLTDAIVWVPVWAVVAAHAKLTVPGPWEF